MIRLTQSNAGRVAVAVYLSASLGVALMFFLAATIGGYDWVARLGGALWVFVLSMIISMPTITPFVRERAAREHH